MGWHGTREIKWESFKSKVQLFSLFNVAPKAVLLHIGGNFFEKSTICSIFNMTRESLRNMKSLFPGINVVWVDILQRRTGNPIAVEKNDAM